MRGDPLGRVGVAGNHHGAGAVDRGQPYPPGVLGELGGELRLGRLDGHHRAPGRGTCHQPTPGGHQACGVPEGERSGYVGGDDLADRVTGHQVRHHAPALEEPGQGDLDGEQRGLGEVRAFQEVGLGVPSAANRTSRTGRGRCGSRAAHTVSNAAA